MYVNFYHNSDLDWHLEDGTGIKIAQATNYPWSGDVKLAVNPARSASFTVYLRWPGWAPSAEVLVNGQPVSLGASQTGSYIALSRTWNPGDSISLSLATATIGNGSQSAGYRYLWAGRDAAGTARLRSGTD